MSQAPLPSCSAGDLEKDSRSAVRMIHSEIGVKFWTRGPPSCAAARPARCAACSAPSREPGKPLTIVGHGLRARTALGPLAVGEAPAQTDVVARRYWCRACDAILVVVPRGIGRGYRYSLGAIALALSLWGYTRATAAATRRQTSTAKVVGHSSPSKWASLVRWTRCAQALFCIDHDEAGTLRERAASIAIGLAAKAPISMGPVPIDAFSGAGFCDPG